VGQPQGGPSYAIDYTYDANGNTLSKVDSRAPADRQDFLYSADDRLVRVTRGPPGSEEVLGLFDYDHAGNRVRHRLSDRGDVDYFYDDGSVLEEHNANDDSLLAYYVYADRLIALAQPAPKGKQYYHHDALGSTIGLTDATGNDAKSYRLDPWGNIRAQSGISDNRRIFTGHEHDLRTGLVYFGARFYDPKTGRFLTQDTYLGESNTPPSLHRYLYAYSNPTVYVDPTGRAVRRDDFGMWQSIPDEDLLPEESGTWHGEYARTFTGREENAILNQRIDEASEVVPGEQRMIGIYPDAPGEEDEYGTVATRVTREAMDGQAEDEARKANLERESEIGRLKYSARYPNALSEAVQGRSHARHLATFNESKEARNAAAAEEDYGNYLKCNRIIQRRYTNSELVLLEAESQLMTIGAFLPPVAMGVQIAQLASGENIVGERINEEKVAAELGMNGLLTAAGIMVPGGGARKATGVGARALRQRYVETAEELGAMAGRLRAGGMSAEDVVRTVSPLRNELKLNIREQGSWFAARAADIRNLLKYGNRAGPSPNNLFRQYGSWDKALDAISRTNPMINRVMGVGP
jgi:RHS repeat-associated protein